MNHLFTTFLMSLVLTLLLELSAACLFKIKGKDLLLVTLVNILTNPAAVLLSLLFGNQRAIQFIIEAVVILTEGCYYKKYGKEIRRAFLFSGVANILSYSMGKLINYMVLCG